jgi:hypothetical protein
MSMITSALFCIRSPPTTILYFIFMIAAIVDSSMATIYDTIKKSWKGASHEDRPAGEHHPVIIGKRADRRAGARGPV